MEDESWNDLTDEEWEIFAQQWMSELRSETSSAVTTMNFTARPELQWQFVLKAVKYAESDDELYSIAAGPVEHLLSFHGPDFIDKVEKLAEVNSKFSKLLCGVWKHTMNEEVWTRLQVVVEKVKTIEEAREQETYPYLDEYHEERFKDAMGSIVHLLGRHVEDFIAIVESRAAESPRFARLLSEITIGNMAPAVWMRLQAIATRHAPPEDFKGKPANDEIK